jgi:hypothetical protein
MSKHLEIIEDLDINLEELNKCYEEFKESKGFSTDNPANIDFNAICINRKPGDPKSISGGNVRGIYWTRPDDTGKEEQRCEQVNEEEYTEICPEFKGTYVETLYDYLKLRFKIGRVRFLMKPPRSCLSWHRDPDKRLHIPITTNKGCHMVIEGDSFHMPANGNGYITDNTRYHNFFNGGETQRVHLVAVLLNDDNDDYFMKEDY